MAHASAFAVCVDPVQATRGGFSTAPRCPRKRCRAGMAPRRTPVAAADTSGIDADRNPGERKLAETESSCFPSLMAPLDHLLIRLHAALENEDFISAALVRDEIDSMHLHTMAESVKPSFSPGLIVNVVGRCHTPQNRSFRGIILCTTDEVHDSSGLGTARFHRKRDRNSRDVGDGVAVSLRLRTVPTLPGAWYRVAIDLDDRAALAIRGANVVLVHEDCVSPCAVSNTENTPRWAIKHPVVGTVFEEAYRLSEDGFVYYPRRTVRS